VGAHLTALRRVAVGSFRVENAVPLERLTDAEEVARRRLGPLAALAHLPELEIDSEGAQRLARGQRVRLAGDAPRGWVAVASGGALVAVAEVDDGVLRPRKVFAP
jgi:tRNA pseudouridine55 synthase